MRFFTRLVLALVVATSAAHALDQRGGSPGAGWEEANRDGDLVVWTKDNASAGAREIIATAEVDAAPATVFQVVGDFENYPKFMPYVKESKVLSRKGDNELVVYSLLSPPLVDDRDYVIDVKKTPGTDKNGGVFKSEWTATPDAQPPREDVVRVKLNTGSWTMEPLDGGKRTRLTYHLLTHPGGSIPTWIANKSNTVAIPDLFKAIKKRAAGK